MAAIRWIRPAILGPAPPPPCQRRCPGPEPDRARPCAGAIGPEMRAGAALSRGGRGGSVTMRARRGAPHVAPGMLPTSPAPQDAPHDRQQLAARTVRADRLV